LKALVLILFFPSMLLARPGYFEPFGYDNDLSYHAMKEKKIEPLSIPVRIANQVISFHQEVISPVDGPRSHYRPSSSNYMRLAMQKYGFLRGFIMGCDRLMRENDEKWVYRTIAVDGQIFKYDPAQESKFP